MYNKYSRTINHTLSRSDEVSYNFYTQETPTVTEKTDDFVNLFNDSSKARSNIKNSPTWLFKMLENGPKTADMLDLVKYLIYKSTGTSYGVTAFGLRIINLKESKSIKGFSTENFIKAWENSPLWKYETQENAPFPTGYLTVDGLNYIVYEDGSGGHNNIAYGWATYISSSTNVKENHPIYGPGYYNHEDTFKAVGINVRELYEGALVDKETANSVFLSKILKDHVDAVDAYLKNNLPEYKFSQAQKDALISMRYQYGNLSNGNFDFATSYRNSLNEDGTINAEKLKNNCSRFDFSDDDNPTVNNRKYANWLLFTQETYIDREGKEMDFGIVASAKKIHDYMSDPDHLYYYCLGGREAERYKHEAANITDCGLNTSFEKSQIPGSYGYRLTCCATYVSWVLIDCGYIENPYHGCGNLVGELQRLKEEGWTRIDNYDDLEAGDIVFMDTDGPNDGSLEHVQIYVGDGCWYNAGGCNSIQRVEPSYDVTTTKYQFLYAYRKN